MSTLILNNQPSFRKFHMATYTSLLVVFLLSGCNTVEGIGEDVEEAGKRIEDAASDH